MMELDLATFGVFLLSFVLCAVLVGVVSLFGAKEKSFEEAVEELKRKREQEQNKSKKNANVTNKTHPAKKVKKKNQEVTTPKVLDDAEPVPMEKSEKESSKKRKRNHHLNKKPQPEGVANEKPEVVTETVQLVDAVKNKTNVLEIHRQYLQDDVADTVETPTSVTPEPPVKETLNLIKEAEAESPASTPEPPVVNKNAGTPKGKKKLVIEEVVTEEPVVTLVESVQQKTSASPLPKGKKSKKLPIEEAIHDAPAKTKLTSKELIASVKKTALDDAESQQLIEILLNKQVGAGSVNGEWVDTGNRGQNNEIKGLQKQLHEKTSALDEEVARTKSITDRMNMLRQELNQAKSQCISTQRLLDDIQGRHQHDIVGIQSRLQQEVDQHQRDVTHLQGQLQYQIGNASSLQVTVEQLQAQLLEAQSMVVDPSIYAELENLRGARAALEAEVASLREQMSKQADSAEAAKGNFSSMEKEKEKAAQEVAKLQKDNKALQEKCKKLESGQKSELSRLESELSDANNRNLKISGDFKQLNEENERLAEQLASNVERPKVEGQEASKVTNGVEEGAQFKQRIAVLEKEKEEITKQNTSQLVKLQAEVKSYQLQIQQVQEELDSQKQKNNDLTSEVGKSKSDSEQSQRALLERLFPEVRVSQKSGESQESWLEKFAAEIKASMSTSEAASSKDEELNRLKKEKVEEAEKLEKQVAHYKLVLAQTENMLNELQSSVESEEKEWKDRVSQKDSELERLRGERDQLEKKNSSLEASLAVVKQAEEMQEKLHELQAKLSEEESEKRSLEKKYSEAEEQLKENKSLKEEVETLKERLSGEKSKNSTLGDKVAKLGQVLTTSQEALTQEQKTVDLLSQGKKGSDENGSPANNDQELVKTPKTPSTSSQMGSIGSLDSNGSNTPKKVSKKKKIMGLFK